MTGERWPETVQKKNRDHVFASCRQRQSCKMDLVFDQKACVWNSRTFIGRSLQHWIKKTMWDAHVNVLVVSRRMRLSQRSTVVRVIYECNILTRNVRREAPFTLMGHELLTHQTHVQVPAHPRHSTNKEKRPRKSRAMITVTLVHRLRHGVSLGTSSNTVDHDGVLLPGLTVTERSHVSPPSCCQFPAVTVFPIRDIPHPSAARCPPSQHSLAMNGTDLPTNPPRRRQTRARASAPRTSTNNRLCDARRTEPCHTLEGAVRLHPT